MKSTIRCIGSRLVVVGLLTTSSLAQVPTMSLEAAAVNGRPVGNDPTDFIAAFPHDIITAEVYIRDWGPNGEALSGYQAALLPVSFSSGKKGFIEPVQYAALQKSGAENTDNSFVDEDNPRFVHKGIKVLSLADTRSEGYRWMSVLLTGTPPKCVQDGRRFYAATVKFEISANAEGIFLLELDSHPDFSGLRKADVSPITPVNFESLTIRVLSDPAQVIDGLNRAGSSPDAPVNANGGGSRNIGDLLLSIEALNAAPEISDESAPTTAALVPSK